MSVNSNSDSFADNASMYDVNQLIARGPIKDPIRFVNAENFTIEREKRLKLKHLYTEQAQKNDQLSIENENLVQQ